MFEDPVRRSNLERPNVLSVFVLISRLYVSAEEFLRSIDRNKNYPILLLKVIERDSFDITIRISASVVFKNYVKRNWKIVSPTIIAIDGDLFRRFDR